MSWGRNKQKILVFLEDHEGHVRWSVSRIDDETSMFLSPVYACGSPEKARNLGEKMSRQRTGNLPVIQEHF